MRNIALLTVLLLSSASPQTLLRGDISDIQFTAEKNPYVIEEDITIPEGKRAEIKAGCILLLNHLQVLLRRNPCYRWYTGADGDSDII